MPKEKYYAKSIIRLSAPMRVKATIESSGRTSNYAQAIWDIYPANPSWPLDEHNLKVYRQAICQIKHRPFFDLHMATEVAHYSIFNGYVPVSRISYEGENPYMVTFLEDETGVFKLEGESKEGPKNWIELAEGAFDRQELDRLMDIIRDPTKRSGVQRSAIDILPYMRGLYLCYWSEGRAMPIAISDLFGKRAISTEMLNTKIIPTLLGL